MFLSNEQASILKVNHYIIFTGIILASIIKTPADDYKATTSFDFKLGIIKMVKHPYVSADNYNPGVSFEALLLRNSTEYFSWGIDIAFSGWSPIKDTVPVEGSWGLYQINRKYSIIEIMPCFRVYYLPKYLYFDYAIGIGFYTLKVDISLPPSGWSGYKYEDHEKVLGETMLFGLGFATGTNPNIGFAPKIKLQHHYGIPPVIFSLGGDLVLDFAF